MSLLLEVAGLVVRAVDGTAMRLPGLALACGQCAALCGPTGAGKSTLLAAMFGLLRRSGWSVSGRVVCQGRDVLAMDASTRRQLLRRDLVFLPQDAPAALDPLAPVGSLVQEATGAAPGAVVAMLGRLGIDDPAGVARRAAHAISGGQAQRVLLAMAFLRAPALVVADEPSASLDGGRVGELVTHLQALRAQGSAVLLATHDARLVQELGATVYSWQGDSFLPGQAPAPAWPKPPPAPPPGEPVLAARGLVQAFASRPVLAGIDFVCRRGEVVAIVGDSGAGKTTLVRVLAGHLRPDAGIVTGPPRRCAVQLVCQDAHGSLTPGRPLRGLLAEAHGPAFQAERDAAAVGLPAPVLAQPRERLSGGERRRAALLRALAVEPDVLVLDEPTASLDRPTAIAVMATLLACQRRLGTAMVLVTHDLEMAQAVAHRVLVLQGGRLCPAS